MLGEGTLYTYTSRNLLDAPEYYMYSEYHGAPFLKAYLSLRAKYADEYEQRYLAHLQSDPAGSPVGRVNDLIPVWRPLMIEVADTFSPDVQAIHAGYSEGTGAAGGSSRESVPTIGDLDGVTEIPTQRFLWALLLALVDRHPAEEGQLYQWLSRFLQGFEVTKKLYATYTVEFKRATSDYHVLTNYSLLALNLVLYYERTQNLKMLNGALKLNDLLCSAEVGLESAEDLLLAIAALRREIACVKGLASERGVVL